MHEGLGGGYHVHEGLGGGYHVHEGLGGGYHVHEGFGRGYSYTSRGVNTDGGRVAMCTRLVVAWY